MMNENMITDAKTEWKFTKDVGNYGDKTENYVIPGELTVTITLAEYRTLVRAAADAEVQKEKNEWLKEYQRRQELEKEVAELKDTIAKITATKQDEEPEC